MNDFGDCALCRGNGMVVVPSLRAMQLGQWGTQAVLCRCALGRWVGARQTGDDIHGQRRPMMMTLDAYESQCGNWRELFAAHDAECEHDLRRKYGRGTPGFDPDSAKKLDQVMDAIIDRMRGKVA